MTRSVDHKGVVLALVAMLCACGSLWAPAAFADDHGGGDRGRHADRGRHVGRHYAPPPRYREHRDYGYDYRGYGGYYPPPIVYGPPEPGFGLNVVIPLRIR